MTPEQISELINRLLNTGEILSTKSFEMALQQIHTYIVLDIVWAVVWLLIMIAAIVVTILPIRAGKKEEKNTSKYRTEEEEYYVSSAFSSVFILAGLVGVVYQANLAYLHVSNPAWYAVKLLVQTFIK
jgi:hypothetical protein